MFRVIIVAEKISEYAQLREGLTRHGFACMTVDQGDAIGQVVKQTPDLVLLKLVDPRHVQSLSQRIKQERAVPVMALVPKDMLDTVNGHLDMDDFIIEPCDVNELVLRAKRLISKTATEAGELISCGDLQIDLAQCEVAVAGRRVELTFREYELLRFLASHRGRVFTRDALLDRVWGYDFFGGDRTVDVHIRRLRSKIEDANHSFIDTVRNIGYRFKES